MQHEFQFAFPYPAGCLHVPEFGSDGYAIDNVSRVCGLACAEHWAKLRGRVLCGESRSFNGTLVIAYRTCAPEQLSRKVHAPISEKPPS